jgi:hypothetical protein
MLVAQIEQEAGDALWGGGASDQQGVLQAAKLFSHQNMKLRHKLRLFGHQGRQVGVWNFADFAIAQRDGVETVLVCAKPIQAYELPRPIKTDHLSAGVQRLVFGFALSAA